MCGIIGVLGNGAGYSPDRDVRRMADTLLHRGPDDGGVWVDEDAGIALGHRRLSILDLSPAGHQPMVSPTGRYVIAFNGEIYNHLELRRDLENTTSPQPLSQGARGHISWRGHSDTETLLACFEAWGIEKTLASAVGMFAIALWDQETRTLHLARDRFGEKPLYYGWVGQGARQAFVFGSELKALRAYPGFDNPVSREALALYMRFTVVPAPYSIYQGIYKLEPGCVVGITGGVPTAVSDPLRPPTVLGGLSLQRWWALGDAVMAGAQNPISDEVEAITALEQRLADAVKLQSLADVPIGAFLSGGVDSSAIVSLMQQQAMRPVKTFTVGFEEAGFDESPYARAVAQHLGTNHSELFVTAAEAQAIIPALPDMYDEPFADSSQIPTHLVCKAARQKVAVALSGDAGDELFGGYNRYYLGARIWRQLAWMPAKVRQALGAAIHTVPVAGWDAVSHPVNAMLPAGKGIADVGLKAHKLATRLHRVRSLEDLHLSLVSAWQEPALLVRGAGAAPVVEPPSLLGNPLPASGLQASQLRMMYRDSLNYLPDDILCKVDRAAMAVSLETRVPFLDHRVAELAWQLPLHMKIRGNEGKWALRQVLYKHVPRELIERPKVGFGIPVGQWLRGPLREWAESLLDEQRLQAEGYFYPVPIRDKWVEHLSGRYDHTPSLWAVLMFQAWLEQQ